MARSTGRRSLCARLDSSPGQGSLQASVAAAARTATQDSTAIAYIGEPDGAATALSVPITNQADLPQIAPGAIEQSLVGEPGSDAPASSQASGERTLIALAGVDPMRLPAPSISEQWGTAYSDRTGRPATPEAAYGYESVALVLDAISRANDPIGRPEVVASLFATSQRDSILGTYTVDPTGVARYSNAPADTPP